MYLVNLAILDGAHVHQTARDAQLFLDETYGGNMLSIKLWRRLVGLCVLMLCAAAEDVCVFQLLSDEFVASSAWAPVLNATGVDPSLVFQSLPFHSSSLPGQVAACPASHTILCLVMGHGNQSTRMFVHEVRRLAFQSRRNQPVIFALSDSSATAARDDPHSARFGIDGTVFLTGTPGLPAYAISGNQHRLPALILSPPASASFGVGLQHQLSPTVPFTRALWHQIVKFANGLLFEMGNRSDAVTDQTNSVTYGPSTVSRPRVAVVHYRSQGIKESEFEGGFVAAMRQLQDAGMYTVTWVNLAEPLPPTLNFDDDFDVVLVKSNWDWIVDSACRPWLAKVSFCQPAGLLK